MTILSLWKKEAKKSRTYCWTLIFIITVCSFISCNSKKAGVPEGNIDVDSDIYIVPIGDIDEKYLTPLVPKLEKRFTTNAYLALDKRMPVTDYSYDEERQQYVAMYMITEMLKKLNFPGDSKILGVCNVDIFMPESGLDFIFGQAIRNGRAAIVSILRMNPQSYVGGKTDDELVIQRLSKEAIHELGHVFGLDNYGDPESVMFLPTTLKELDRKTDNFCLPEQKDFRELTKKKKDKVK